MFSSTLYMRRLIALTGFIVKACQINQHDCTKSTFYISLDFIKYLKEFLLLFHIYFFDSDLAVRMQLII